MKLYKYNIKYSLTREIIISKYFFQQNKSSFHNKYVFIHCCDCIEILISIYFYLEIIIFFFVKFSQFIQILSY